MLRGGDHTTSKRPAQKAEAGAEEEKRCRFRGSAAVVCVDHEEGFRPAGAVRDGCRQAEEIKTGVDGSLRRSPLRNVQREFPAGVTDPGLGSGAGEDLRRGAGGKPDVSVGVEENEDEVFQANGAAGWLVGIEDDRDFGGVRNLKGLVMGELRRRFFEAADVAALAEVSVGLLVFVEPLHGCA